MRTEYKLMKFRVPLELYEEFYRLFPARGERQTLLSRIISQVVQKSRDSEDYWKEIAEGLRD